MMKYKTIIIALSILLYCSAAFSQSKLHIPKEFQEAYTKETRSKDGNPGKKYWQNSVDYKIDVAVTPASRLIDGKETIVFTNNSPDALSSIVIRLYYDVFKKGNQRGMQVNEKDIGNGTDIKKILVGGKAYDLSNREQINRRGTNMTLRLDQPLKTKEKITIEFEWQQKVPLTVRRTGAIDDSSFFIAYWYPQVAVYDDVFGWDRIDYTYDTEFYNNLSNFDVRITAPDNFLVWATGTLENSEKVLPDAIHKKYSQAKTSKELVHVVTAQDLKDLKLKSNTWNFKATEVSDFAFAMSDHYLWDALSQKVSNTDVLIATAYPKEQAAKYTEVTKVQQKTMKHFSEDIPGIPYPYPEFTTFIGLKGGGMEFPMMANNAGPGKGVTIHEMFHTYFPMYVRVNERRFAWMDEGWADFITTLVTYKYFKDDTDTSSLYSNLKLGMQGMIGSIGDLPTVTSSQYMGNNYGYHSYTLPSFTYALLYQHLGEEKFLKCFRTYITRWAKKSPTPYDFFYTFEDVSGEDLSFLWNSWYFKMGYPDVAIQSFKNGNLEIKSNGDRPVPVSIQVVYDHKEGEEKETYATMVGSSVWKNNTTTHTIKIPKANKVKSLIINNDFPDFNELDNYYPSLSDRYKDFKLNDDIIGKYAINQFPISAIIAKKEGIYNLKIQGVGLNTYLLPIDATNFASTDGTMKIKLKKDEKGAQEIEVAISSFGITLTGTKE